MQYQTENRRGLVGHWKAHGAVAASGTWHDVSGYGRNATLVGAATVDATGLLLNGSTGCGQVPYNASLAPAALTLMTWVKLSAYTFDAYFVSYGDSASNGYHFGMLNDKYVLLFGGGSGGILYSADSVSTGVWQHLTVSYPGSSNGSNFYIDGVLNNTGTLPTFGSPSSDIFIGRRGQGSNFVNGIQDDIRIYNRVLSAEEIKQIHQSTKGRH